MLQNKQFNVSNRSVSQRNLKLDISQKPEGILVISQALKVDLVS